MEGVIKLTDDDGKEVTYALRYGYAYILTPYSPDFPPQLIFFQQANSPKAGPD